MKRRERWCCVGACMRGERGGKGGGEEVCEERESYGRVRGEGGEEWEK